MRQPVKTAPADTNQRHYPAWATAALVATLFCCCIGCNSQEWQNDYAELLEAEPDAAMSPDDVVEIQVESIRSGIPAVIETSYRFTSPKGQFMSGPSDRFAKIMSNEPYWAMRDAERIDYFDVEIRDLYAKQIVQCVDENGEATLYLFELTRQGAGEFAGCWLIESVTCSNVQFQIEGTEAAVR